jgi:hypothetical protein
MTDDVILRDHGRFDRAWNLSVQAGSIRETSGRCHGHVRVLGDETVCALYAADDRLWFQYGDRRWNADDVALLWARGAAGDSIFTVSTDEGLELEIIYRSPTPDPFDPTYDWIDTLEDDFLRWVAEVLPDRDSRRQRLELYRIGFE